MFSASPELCATQVCVATRAWHEPRRPVVAVGWEIAAGAMPDPAHPGDMTRTTRQERAGTKCGVPTAGVRRRTRARGGVRRGSAPALCFGGMPKGTFVVGNVLSLTDRNGRARHLIGRRSRRLEAEAAEVAEIDRWLAKMRSGPEMVLYSAHPTSVKPTRPATPNPARRNKKRRR